jgi:acetyl esterase/lipase
MNAMRRALRVLVPICLPVAAVGAAEPRPGEPLWPNGAPGALGSEPKDVPRLFAYPLKEVAQATAAVVVCPGGGYGGLAVGYEGHEVAEWLNTIGVAGFVLTYRHAPDYRHPAPLQDAQRAIQTVRARAREWNVDPRRIGILGFSAGGHLSAHAGVSYVEGDTTAGDPVGRVSSRPDFLVLVYPVISMLPPEGHAGSARNLLGDNATREQLEAVSPHLHVTRDTPPAFLVHTTEDEGVSARNPLLFYGTLLQAGVSCELHIFQQGRHGLGLGNKPPALPFGEWPGLCEKWFRAQGIIAE